VGIVHTCEFRCRRLSLFYYLLLFVWSLGCLNTRGDAKQLFPFPPQPLFDCVVPVPLAPLLFLATALRSLEAPLTFTSHFSRSFFQQIFSDFLLPFFRAIFVIFFVESPRLAFPWSDDEAHRFSVFYFSKFPPLSPLLSAKLGERIDLYLSLPFPSFLVGLSLSVVFFDLEPMTII